METILLLIFQGYLETNKMIVILLDFFSISQKLITSQMAEWRVK